jgi:hypothetical protein
MNSDAIDIFYELQFSPCRLKERQLRVPYIQPPEVERREEKA